MRESHLFATIGPPFFPCACHKAPEGLPFRNRREPQQRSLPPLCPPPVLSRHYQAIYRLILRIPEFFLQHLSVNASVLSCQVEAEPFVVLESLPSRQRQAQDVHYG